MDQPTGPAAASTSDATTPVAGQTHGPLARPIQTASHNAQAAAPPEPATPPVGQQAATLPRPPAEPTGMIGDSRAQQSDERLEQVAAADADGQEPQLLRTLREQRTGGTTTSLPASMSASKSAAGTTASTPSNGPDGPLPAIAPTSIAASSTGTEADPDGQSTDQQRSPFQDRMLADFASIASASPALQAANENFQPLTEQVITEPAIQRQVTEQVVASALERARIVQQEGQSRMELQLSPPELGRIRIEISRTERGLKMRVAAESTATARILRTNLEEIQSHLEAAEMPVESVDVFGGNAGDDSGAANQSFDESFRPQGVPKQYGQPGTPEAAPANGTTSASSDRIDVKA
ncbi:MAG: flagellar hook-length control protein FliK [Maioricimonas sp. JB049]